MTAIETPGYLVWAAFADPPGWTQNWADLSADERLRWERAAAAAPARDWTGAEITDGAGPDDFCGCGETITWFQGCWMHIYNPELRGTDDHEARPGDGYYEPESEEDDDGER